MTFQVSDNEGKHFLDLHDVDREIMELSYSKGRIWIKYIGHLNLLYTRAIRAITNYASIEEY